MKVAQPFSALELQAGKVTDIGFFLCDCNDAAVATPIEQELRSDGVVQLALERMCEKILAQKSEHSRRM